MHEVVGIISFYGVFFFPFRYLGKWFLNFMLTVHDSDTRIQAHTTGDANIFFVFFFCSLSRSQYTVVGGHLKKKIYILEWLTMYDAIIR